MKTTNLVFHMSYMNHYVLLSAIQKNQKIKSQTEGDVRMNVRMKVHDGKCA